MYPRLADGDAYSQRQNGRPRGHGHGEHAQWWTITTAAIVQVDENPTGK